MQDKVRPLLMWTGVIITYLFVEWIYNQHLLDILLLEHISNKSFNNTEIFGKLIASFGINLFLLKIFNYTKKKFCIGLIISYIMLTFLFNYAINSFSDDFRYSSYYSMLYRQDVLKNKDKDQLLSLKTNEDNWYEKSLLMSYFVFTLNGEEWKEYEKSAKKPVSDQVKKLNNDMNKNWQQYHEVSLLKKKLDNGYAGYQKLMVKYSAYRYGSYKKRAYQAFLKATGGLEPDLTQEQFLSQVGAGKTYLKFLNKIFYEGSTQYEIKSITGKDLPLDMNKPQFIAYVNNLIETNSKQIAPDLKDIRHNILSETPVAVLIIPPISIALSLMSIILNVSLLIISWILMLPQLAKHTWLISAISSSIFIIMLCIISNINNNILDNEPNWKKMEVQASLQYPVLSYFWKFSFNLEPLVCSKNKSKIVTTITQMLYKNDSSKNNGANAH